MHKYVVRIRLNGRVSCVEVTANDSNHARSLVNAMYDGVTILNTKRV